MIQTSNADLTAVIMDLHEVIKNLNKEYQVDNNTLKTNLQPFDGKVLIFQK